MKNVSYNPASFLLFILFVFVMLKLFGVILVPWRLILCPIWVPLCTAIMFVVFGAAAYFMLFFIEKAVKTFLVLKGRRK